MPLLRVIQLTWTWPDQPEMTGSHSSCTVSYRKIVIKVTWIGYKTQLGLANTQFANSKIQFVIIILHWLYLLLQFLSISFPFSLNNEHLLIIFQWLLDKISILRKCIVVAQVLHFLRVAPHGLSQDPLLRVASPCAMCVIAGYYLDCWSLRSVHCWFRITTTTTQRLLSHRYYLPGCQVPLGDDWGTFWTTSKYEYIISEVE